MEAEDVWPTLRRSFPEEDDSNLDPDDLDGKPQTRTSEAGPDQPFMRSMNENTKEGMNVGNPVAATDADNDMLLYSIIAGDRCGPLQDR